MFQPRLPITRNISKAKVYYVYDKKPQNSITFYVNFTSFQDMKHKIENYLFKEGNFPKTTLRFFWFDRDGDEIEILMNNDLKYVFEGTESQKVIWVKPKNLPNKPLDTISTNGKGNVAIKKRKRGGGKKHDDNNNNKPNNKNKGNDKNIKKVKTSNESLMKSMTHVGAKCNNCLMHPIVGFRYKCVECHNYNICEDCERKHIHLDHMMIRMPNNNCSKMLSENSKKCSACDGDNNEKTRLKDIAASVTKSNIFTKRTRIQKRIHRVFTHVYAMFENGLDTSATPSLWKNINTSKSNSSPRFVNHASETAQISGDAQISTAADAIAVMNLLVDNNNEVKCDANNIVQKKSNTENAKQNESADVPISTARLNKATENQSGSINIKNEFEEKSSAVFTAPLLLLETFTGARPKTNSNNSKANGMEFGAPIATIQNNDETMAAIGGLPEDYLSAVIVYHPDPLINAAIHQMMLMGFSNENGALTQLVESVNGNISEALDLISSGPV